MNPRMQMTSTVLTCHPVVSWVDTSDNCCRGCWCMCLRHDLHELSALLDSPLHSKCPADDHERVNKSECCTVCEERARAGKARHQLRW